MSDSSSPFGFGKFVPGFDFLQNLAKGATSGIPQLPNLSNWVAPTINVEELEKRIEELKAVQFWLEQNSRALAATIQALEVQKMTLATLQGMNFSMGDVANAFKLKTADTLSGLAGTAARAMGAAPAPAPEPPPAPAPAPAAASEPAPEPEPTPRKRAAAAKQGGPAAATPGLVDPLQWWGALTSQFQEIAANAMKDAARQTAIDTTKSVASGLAKDAFKTATGVAGQMAAKGMQSMQDATRMAGSAALAGAARVAGAGRSRKAAPAPAAVAKPAVKAPAKKAAKATKATKAATGTARRPRKPAA